MKKLLIVVDYQNDFVDGSLGFEDAIKIENNIHNIISNFKNTNDDVIFTLDTHYSNYMETKEGEKLPVPHCIKGTDGHNIYGIINNDSKDYLKIEKITFGSIELANYLMEHQYDEITLVGVVTNICVLSNAVIVKTTLPNAKIIVDASCCASNDLSLEQKAYDILENLHIEIVNR